MKAFIFGEKRKRNHDLLRKKKAEMELKWFFEKNITTVVTALPLFSEIFKTNQPSFPILQHQLWAQLMSMGTWAILVRHYNESILNLQWQEISGLWGKQWHKKTSKIRYSIMFYRFNKGIKRSHHVSHLVLIVAIIVQSPSIGCHLNRVVIRVAQEWFGLLRSLPVNKA